MSASFDRTRARLETDVREGWFTRGAQVTVLVDGARALDVALGDDGLGAATTPAHVFRVYCSIKPVTAVAVAGLVDEGAVDLDQPLDGVLPDVPVLGGGVTLRHVLTHTAGLHRPSAVEMELVTPAKRRSVVERSARPSGWRLGRDAAYSEYTGWHVLGWVIEAVTGGPLRRALRARVLDPVGMGRTWIGMDRDDYARAVPSIGVNHDLRGDAGFPMLFERTERVCRETNPAHGGYTNGRDLAAFYQAVLDRLAGGGNAALPSSTTLREFCSPARPAVHDEVLDRTCSYGLGFMTGLRDHAFGDACGPSSFGHSGNVGASFAFADPDRALAVAVVFNGIVDHETAFVRRRALVNAIYADLDSDDAAARTAGDRSR